MAILNTVRKALDADASMTAASKGFGKYKPEEEKRGTVLKVEHDPAITKLMEFYRVYRRFEAFYEPSSCIIEAYSKAERLVEKGAFSSEDIKKFMVSLSSEAEERNFSLKTGLFVSALMNQSHDDEFVIPARHLPPIEYLGYRNRKSVTVDGGVGEYLGFCMTGGKIVVHGSARDCCANKISGGHVTICGNAGDWAGWSMEAGILRIHGNVGMGAGRAMKGGILVVGGDAGEDLGQGMRGGEIHVNGNIESVYKHIDYRNVGGNIFQKGKLVVDRLDYGWKMY